MGTFEAKEGLFEYSIKRLGTHERKEALRRVARSVPAPDDSLREFLSIDCHTDQAADTNASQGGAIVTDV